jgi:hypothetical protein
MASEAITIAPGLAPAAPLMRLLSRFDRAKVEAFAEVSIALLDLIDGDENLEDDDPAEEDDPAGQYDEDVWSSPLRAGDTFHLGPGCPIADPGEEEVAI